MQTKPETLALHCLLRAARDLATAAAYMRLRAQSGRHSYCAASIAAFLKQSAVEVECAQIATATRIWDVG